MLSFSKSMAFDPVVAYRCGVAYDLHLTDRQGIHPIRHRNPTEGVTKLMFQTKVHRSKTSSMFSMLAVTYHTIVYQLRGGHRNAIIGILYAIAQGMTLVIIFFGMFQILGMRSSPIRGDYLLFIMSGVFLYMAHIQVVSGISKAGNPTSSMNLHSPMNTIVAIASAAIAALYRQMWTVLVVLAVYHLAYKPITMEAPIMALGMLLVCWFSGVAVGLVFLALTPWAPNLVPLIMQIYIRANMIASGKMFAANTLPAAMIAVFDWNPLFHAIDQARGFIFLHYTPMMTSLTYPIYLSCVLFVLGLMGEFYSRQHASLSWFAGR
jgi:ABC-type polysaccharide/polyol phosphate export permease